MAGYRIAGYRMRRENVKPRVPVRYVIVLNGERIKKRSAGVYYSDNTPAETPIVPGMEYMAKFDGEMHPVRADEREKLHLL